MLPEIFFDCVRHEGVVTIGTTNAEGKVHLINTWNKYLIVKDDDSILMPAFGMRHTEHNAAKNNYAEVTVCSHEVQGKMGMGTGCLLTGTIEFQKEGPLFDEMKTKCSFANRVLVFHPATCKQTI